MNQFLWRAEYFFRALWIIKSWGPISLVRAYDMANALKWSEILDGGMLSPREQMQEDWRL